MDLAGWNSACLMCGVLSMEGLVPIFVLQSVPVSSRDAARVLKKLHLFSAGQQKGTEFRQRYKWCIHVRWQQVLQPKVKFPNFISSFCCSLPYGDFSRNQKYRIIPASLSLLCTTQTDVLFLADAQFVGVTAGNKVQRFYLSLVIFFITINVQINPNRGLCNNTSF